MLRLLFSFVILFIGGAVLLAVLPSPAKTAMPVAPTVAASTPEAGSADRDKGIRVVYPPTNPAEDPSLKPVPSAVQQQETAVPAGSPRSVSVATAAQSESGAPGGATTTPEVATPQADIDAVLHAIAKTDINTASIAQLDQIPGGGPIGRAIASRRPYGSVDDLLTRRVLRKAVYDRIKDQIAVK